MHHQLPHPLLLARRSAREQTIPLSSSNIVPMILNKGALTISTTRIAILVRIFQHILAEHVNLIFLTRRDKNTAVQTGGAIHIGRRVTSRRPLFNVRGHPPHLSFAASDMNCVIIQRLSRLPCHSIHSTTPKMSSRTKDRSTTTVSTSSSLTLPWF